MFVLNQENREMSSEYQNLVFNKKNRELSSEYEMFVLLQQNQEFGPEYQKIVFQHTKGLFCINKIKNYVRNTKN